MQCSWIARIGVDSLDTEQAEKTVDVWMRSEAVTTARPEGPSSRASLQIVRAPDARAWIELHESGPHDPDFVMLTDLAQAAAKLVEGPVFVHTAMALEQGETDDALQDSQVRYSSVVVDGASTTETSAGVFEPDDATDSGYGQMLDCLTVISGSTPGRASAPIVAYRCRPNDLRLHLYHLLGMARIAHSVSVSQSPPIRVSLTGSNGGKTVVVLSADELAALQRRGFAVTT